MAMRRTLLALLTLLPALLLGTVVVPAMTQPASASCAAPELTGVPKVLEHDRVQIVRGRYFQRGCADTIVCTPRGCHPTEQATPRKRVPLRLHQDGRVWLLDRSDATRSMRVRWSFELPRGVEAGTAWLTAPDARRVKVRVR